MSLFSDLKPKAHLNMNVFDLSRTETFSSKLGMLTPCFVQHTVPKGKYRINVSDIVRVSEQQTANFVGMSQNVEFAFVPYSQLWREFNRFYYGKGEEVRSNGHVDINVRVPASVYAPTFQLGHVVEQIFRACLVANWWNQQYRHLREVYAQNPSQLVIPSGALEYLRLFDVVGDGDWYERPHTDIHGRFCGFDQLRLLDMLGYGNFLPLLKYVMVDLGVVSDVSQLVNYINTNVDSRIQLLLDTVLDSIPFENLYNPFAIMAYVKFYSDIYRNRNYDDKPYFRLYNCDWAEGNSSTGILGTSDVLFALKPFYRQYKKDLFTGLYPDAQFGSVSVAGIGKGSLISDYKPTSQQNVYTLGSNSEFPSHLYVAGGNVQGVNWTFTGTVSALAVRQAEALQKLKEKLVRAGNREKDLQKAIFGVGSKYIEDSYVDFLGSFQSVIQMNPVAATTATSSSSPDVSGQNIGDLGAYSVGSIDMGSQKEIEFESYDFGIIIGVVYVLPETKYESYGVDPFNIKFRNSDYYQPQMQNLGLSPVYSYYHNQLGLAGAVPEDRVLGYLSRYWEYKTAVSRVHGEFYGSNPRVPYDMYDNAIGDDSSANNALNASFGAFSDFVAPRDVRETTQPTTQMLYVNPGDADRIFYVSDDIYQSFDQFKFEMSFRVKAVLPMSVTGLPD